MKKTAVKERKTAKKQVKKVKKQTRQPLDGVEYSRIKGAKCPICFMPGGYTQNTMPWEDGIRIRYHVCRRCGGRFKSIEAD